MNGRVTVWLLGIFAALIIGWASALSSAAISHAERITRVEVTYDEILRRLERIENKLDAQ